MFALYILTLGESLDGHVRAIKFDILTPFFPVFKKNCFIYLLWSDVAPVVNELGSCSVGHVIVIKILLAVMQVSEQLNLLKYITKHLFINI